MARVKERTLILETETEARIFGSLQVIGVIAGQRSKYRIEFTNNIAAETARNSVEAEKVRPVDETSLGF